METRRCRSAREGTTERAPKARGHGERHGSTCDVTDVTAEAAKVELWLGECSGFPARRCPPAGRHLRAAKVVRLRCAQPPPRG